MAREGGGWEAEALTLWGRRSIVGIEGEERGEGELVATT